ncbi:MAG: hypothetical protein CMB38_04475 [Euryarchaeota archaeon]|nr:hypothetical protein [Euryarchaeota archaeon]
MNHVRTLAFLLVAVMLGSLTVGLSDSLVEVPEDLENTPVVMSATSPGHPVFAEYVGAYWCGPCQTSSNSLHSLYGTNGGGGTQSEDFTYVSFWESPTTGWPSETPINRRAHISPSGYPTTVFGDAASGQYYTSGGQSYNSFYQSGGNMQNANDYALTIMQSQSGSNMNIDITASYLGSGSKTVYIYAAVTEETSPEVYSNSNNLHPHHVFQQWLLNSAQSGFESVTLTNGNPVTKSWTVPISAVSAGGGKSAAENFLTVAALMNGDHTNHRSVVSAADSNMGPKLDLALTGMKVSNDVAPDSYIRGDTVDLEVTVRNIGDLDYTDGGGVEFYYRDGANKVPIGGTQSLPATLFQSGTRTYTASFDTSALSSNAWKTTFGARLTGLTGDTRGANNDVTSEFNHDRPPVALTPQVNPISVERGAEVLITVRADANDEVDTTASTTFELETRKSGTSAWSSDGVSGGEDVVFAGSPFEGREYTYVTTIDMETGTYDLRVRAIDARNQASDWKVMLGSDGLTVRNAVPTIWAEPVPSVMCDEITKVDMFGHITDRESDLSELSVSSNSPAFRGWDSSTGEIEVLFAFDELRGCPLGQNGIEVTVDDGEDYTGSNLPYGTLLFNVFENGQPRWDGLPTRTVDEGGSGSFALLDYVYDTDEDGVSVDSQSLTLSIVRNSNPEVFNIDLQGDLLSYSTVDDDVNGQAIVTLRASDGVQTADQTILLKVAPVNDAPRMDLGELASIEIKRGNTQLFDLQSLAYDIDDTTAPFISVTSTETGAANLDFLTGVMSLTFEELGRQNVMITVQDSYDKNTYTMAVEVYDSKPFYASKDADTGYMTVDISSAYIGEEAVANMFLTDNAPTFTSITAMWQVCESDTGVCLNQVTYPLDMASAERGWSFDLVFDDVRPFGLQYNDDVKLGNLLATDDTGEEYKLLSPIYWRIMDEAPSPDAMDDDELITHIADLEATIDQLKLDIASSGGDTTAEEAQLETLQADLAEACDDPRADCTSDSVQADGSVDPALSINTDVIIIILGVLILAALLGILFTRRGGPVGQQKWDYNALPSGDAVANSMYGGAQAIFQQPLQAPALPLPQLPALAPPLPTPQPYAGPPLPASGLPPGWTMEQWAYYGQQYLDRLQ